MRGRYTQLTPIELITSPFVRFARVEAAGGIMLLVATLAALAWANSPWQHSYQEIFEQPLSIGFGTFTVTEDWHAWINDGLMSIFFFLVGLEIKREVLVGELSSLGRAVLPFVGALGGMVAPALIYIAIAHDRNLSKGWAIPISTDIAFTLGVLAFLGRRVPISLKVFVTALAIVDDIFAVIVIAVFYTSQINLLGLVLGLACILVALLANLLGIRNPAIYAFIGFFAWFCVLSSGVHATIAGVLMAFTIPARTFLDKSEFLDQSRRLLDKLDDADANSFDEHSILHTLEQKIELVESPLHRIEHSLQPWIGFLIMPLFALANAGVSVLNFGAGAIRHPAALGIVAGLAIGKPLGIWIFSYLAVKVRLASALVQVSWRQILGAASLCGIGFTMSIFVAGLAFESGPTLEIAKIAILAASVLSAILGCSILLARAGSSEEIQAAQDAE